MKINGKKFLVEFGMAKAILFFENENKLTFTIIQREGLIEEEVETVNLNLTPLRKKLFLATWKEADGTTVSQVHDHKNGIIYSNWTTPQGVFTNVQGTIKPLEESK